MESAPDSAHKKSKRLGLTIGLVVITMLIGVGLGLWLPSGQKKIHVPEAIAQTAKSSIYLPKKMPSNYKVDEGSFSIQEGEVLMFFASDGADGRIVFTEQPRPKQDFDFDSFYQGQLQGAETIKGAPFPTVVGKTHNQQTIMISIVTPDTWVIASSNAPLTTDDMRLLAQHITKYSQ